MKIAAMSLLSLASLALLAPSQARAVEPLDTVSFRIGGYITSWDTEVRADGTHPAWHGGRPQPRLRPRRQRDHRLRRRDLAPVGAATSSA